MVVDRRTNGGGRRAEDVLGLLRYRSVRRAIVSLLAILTPVSGWLARDRARVYDDLARLERERVITVRVMDVRMASVEQRLDANAERIEELHAALQRWFEKGGGAAPTAGRVRR